MPQIKRAGNYLTENLTENSKKIRTICTDGGEALDSIIAGDLYLDVHSEEPIDNFRDRDKNVWSELSKEVTSKFSRTVVSLAVSDGHKVLFACSGIALQRRPIVTCFLTSASLVKAYNDKKREGHGNLKIEVRRNGKVARGLLGDYDFDQEIALVNIMIFSLGVRLVDLDRQVDFLPCSKVVAVGRADSGTLMATTGMLTGDSTGSEVGLTFSTCKISEAWQGGPLFDCDGNFVGMNLFLAGEGAFFVPRSIIIKHLEKYMLKKEVKTVRHVEIQRPVQPWPYRTYPRDRSGELDSLSYPKPSAATIRGGLKLFNTFEETFGDFYGSGKGVWSQLRKSVSQKLSRVVVSLASFSGKTRVFACTGLLIEWNECTIILTSASLVRDPNDENKTAKDLKIEVFLPNKQRKEGILQHFSLHYNVALVGVKDFRPLRSFRIPEDLWNNRTRDPNVVAVGRCFISGDLMATCGRATDWSGMLDYRDLRYSSCKITKAGIGGPLVDFSGRFIGMNFYDKKIGTPFIFRDCIIRVLAHFERKSTIDKVSEVRSDGKPIRAVDEFGSDGTPIRWPVPVPCLRHPADERKDSLPPGYKEKSGPFGFTYVNGERADYY